MRYGCGAFVEVSLEEAGVGAAFEVLLSLPVNIEASLSVGAMIVVVDVL